MAKHSLFWPPLGWFLRGFGGLPVRRDKRHNLVTTLAGLFDDDHAETGSLRVRFNNQWITD